MAAKNTEDLRNVGILNFNLMKLRREGNYIVNLTQLEKFNRICDIVQSAVLEANGQINSISLAPEEGYAIIEATFDNLECVQNCIGINRIRSVLTIHPDREGAIHICCTIPMLFDKKKDQPEC